MNKWQWGQLFHLRLVHTAQFFVNATAIKMGCVDVKDCLYGATAMHLCVRCHT